MMSGGKQSARNHLDLNLNLIAFKSNCDEYDAVVNDV